MSDAGKFDAVVRKLISVPREELRRREATWKEDQAQKKQAKTLPASSRVSTAKG